jgi:hydrogenase maturation protease
MKSTLVVGLGNPLSGDDGVGVHVVEELKREAALQPLADFVVAGDDLLAASKHMEGRRRVILVDAMLGDPKDGAVEIHDEPFDGISTSSEHAHCQSVVDCVKLLKGTHPHIDSARFSILGVVIDRVRATGELSTEVKERMPWVLRVARDYIRDV